MASCSCNPVCFRTGRKRKDVNGGGASRITTRPSEITTEVIGRNAGVVSVYNDHQDSETLLTDAAHLTQPKASAAAAPPPGPEVPAAGLSTAISAANDARAVSPQPPNSPSASIAAAGAAASAQPPAASRAGAQPEISAASEAHGSPGSPVVKADTLGVKLMDAGNAIASHLKSAAESASSSLTAVAGVQPTGASQPAAIDAVITPTATGASDAKAAAESMLQRAFQTRHLHIQVRGASRIVPDRMDGSANPKLQIACGKVKYWTRAIPSCLDPGWHEEYTYTGEAVVQAKGIIALEVWSHEDWHDDFLGQAELDVAKLLPRGLDKGAVLAVSLPLYVVSRKGSRMEGDYGDVHLRIWAMREEALGQAFTAGVMLGPQGLTSGLSTPGVYKHLPSVATNSYGTLYEEPCLIYIKMVLTEIKGVGALVEASASNTFFSPKNTNTVSFDLTSSSMRRILPAGVAEKAQKVARSRIMRSKRRPHRRASTAGSEEGGGFRDTEDGEEDGLTAGDSSRRVQVKAGLTKVKDKVLAGQEEIKQGFRKAHSHMRDAAKRLRKAGKSLTREFDLASTDLVPSLSVFVQKAEAAPGGGVHGGREEEEEEGEFDADGAAAAVSGEGSSSEGGEEEDGEEQAQGMKGNEGSPKRVPGSWHARDTTRQAQQQQGASGGAQDVPDGGDRVAGAGGLGDVGGSRSPRSPSRGAAALVGSLMSRLRYGSPPGHHLPTITETSAISRASALSTSTPALAADPPAPRLHMLKQEEGKKFGGNVWVYCTVRYGQQCFVSRLRRLAADGTADMGAQSFVFAAVRPLTPHRLIVKIYATTDKARKGTRVGQLEWSMIELVQTYSDARDALRSLPDKTIWAAVKSGDAIAQSVSAARHALPVLTWPLGVATDALGVPVGSLKMMLGYSDADIRAELFGIPLVAPSHQQRQTPTSPLPPQPPRDSVQDVVSRSMPGAMTAGCTSAATSSPTAAPSSSMLEALSSLHTSQQPSSTNPSLVGRVPVKPAKSKVWQLPLVWLHLLLAWVAHAIAPLQRLVAPKGAVGAKRAREQMHLPPVDGSTTANGTPQAVPAAAARPLSPANQQAAPLNAVSPTSNADGPLAVSPGFEYQFMNGPLGTMSSEPPSTSTVPSPGLWNLTAAGLLGRESSPAARAAEEPPSSSLYVWSSGLQKRATGVFTSMQHATQGWSVWNVAGSMGMPLPTSLGRPGVQFRAVPKNNGIFRTSMDPNLHFVQSDTCWHPILGCPPYRTPTAINNSNTPAAAHTATHTPQALGSPTAASSTPANGMAASPSASQQATTPMPLAKLGPVGVLTMTLEHLELKGVPIGTSYYVLLACGPHWVRSVTRKVGDAPIVRWELRLPIYDVATVLYTATFIESGTFTKTSALACSSRFQLSRLPPNVSITTTAALLQAAAAQPQEEKEKEKGSGVRGIAQGLADAFGVPIINGVPGLVATTTMRLNYNSQPKLVTAYITPARPSAWYDLMLDDAPEGLLHKQYQVIVSRWLACSSPSIPEACSAKVMSTPRDKFEFGRIKANFRRVKLGISPALDVMDHVKQVMAWGDPHKSIRTIVIIILSLFFPTYMATLGMGLLAYRGWRGRVAVRGQRTQVYGEEGSAQESDPEVAAGSKYDELKRRYQKVVQVALATQNTMDDIAKFLERAQALLAWHDPAATAIVLVMCAVGGVAVLIVGLPTLLSLVVVYVMRPPRFRDPLPTPPEAFFGRLPTRYMNTHNRVLSERQEK